MTSFNTLGFVATLVTAALGIQLSNRLKLPSSVGLILTGLLFGPAFLGLVKQSEITDFLAHIGLMFLMFKIGLESDIQLLRSKESFFVGFLGLLFPWIGGFVFMWMFNYSIAESFFVGVILTATSVGITVSILNQMNVLNKRFAKTILGAAIADDILGLFALSIATTFAASGSINSVEILKKIVITLAIIVFSVVFGIKLLSIMRFIKKYKVDKAVIYLVLFSFVLLSGALAEDIGLSGIVGAFLAGLMVTESGFESEEKKFEHMIDPLVLLFSPLFFLNLGLLVTFDQLKSGFLIGIMLAIIAIITKYAGCFFAARKYGMDQLDATIVGLGMIPRGEVALITAQIGLGIGVIQPEIFSSIIVMTIITSFLPPLIFFYALTPYTNAKTIEEFEKQKKKVISRLDIISRLRIHLEEARLKGRTLRKRVVKF
ncbi:MAG: cation:proton antiporter [Candidatus Aenigmarchaeota archaeon]|nr:cation:proton antiporter [Candidatus Aenigmarchaeota archaeon]